MLLILNMWGPGELGEGKLDIYLGAGNVDISSMLQKNTNNIFVTFRGCLHERCPPPLCKVNIRDIIICFQMLPWRCACQSLKLLLLLHACKFGARGRLTGRQADQIGVENVPDITSWKSIPTDSLNTSALHTNSVPYAWLCAHTVPWQLWHPGYVKGRYPYWYAWALPGL